MQPKDEHRIITTKLGICPHTHKPIIQNWDGQEWVCAHFESKTLSPEVKQVIDEASVDGFKAGYDAGASNHENL